ncbi:TPA: hypothetical protein ACQJJL_005520, partial [Raoultella ornithinolytica]
MSENNYGALMMKSALSASDDIDSLMSSGIYPVPPENPSSPTPGGGVLTILPGQVKFRTFTSDSTLISTSLFNKELSIWEEWIVPVSQKKLGSDEGTKSIGIPGSGGTLHDWISGQLRSMFYYLSPAKIASVIGGAATDITTELQAAMNDNRPIWLPAGQYYVTGSITASANSSLIGPGPRLASIDN